METAENKYITVAYKLYTMEDGEKNCSKKQKLNILFNSFQA